MVFIKEVMPRQRCRMEVSVGRVDGAMEGTVSTNQEGAVGQRGLGGLLASLGPGLLFAAAAVGVSHLVQSTRAGAMYGLAMVGFIILANIAKYPAFRFGPQYAAATGRSLLEGYRRQGTWALVLYTVLTLGTMFTVQAAVTVVTAALVKATLGLSLGPLPISVALLVFCGALLAVGDYRWLDRLVRVLVVVLTLSTLVATAMVVPRVDWSGPWLWPEGGFDAKTLAFTAALVGWMPSAIDVAVWQSLWTLARARESGHKPTQRESMFDFHVGYLGTVVLALCFMLLGAGVMHGSGEAFAASAGGFAAQVLGLYTKTLGAWSRPIIGLCAIMVMFSTTLAVLDGFPRAMATLVMRFRVGAEPDGDELATPQGRRAYLVSVVVLALGSVVVLALLLQSLKAMVDIATTLSFLTAPILAWLNHRAILAPEVPEADRPKPWLRALSMLSIVGLSAFAIFYLVMRFGG